MSKTPAKMTAHEFLVLGEDATWRFELIRGEMVAMPMAGWKHGVMTAHVVSRLGIFTKSEELGVVLAPETGYIVERDPDTVLNPDGGIVRKERLPSDVAADDFVDGAPDIAVEVLSEEERFVYVYEKIAMYLRAGGQRVWIVDRFNRIVLQHDVDGTARILTPSDDLSGDDFLRGFRMPIAEIFDGLTT